MRVMARNAFEVRIVDVRVNAPDIRPSARWIGESGMASQTGPSAFVYNEFRWIGRVFYGRPMTVFTLNDRMGGHRDAFMLIGMAGLAVFRPLVFDREILPEFDIVSPVPSVHIPPLMDAETFGDIERPCDEHESDKSEHYP